MHHLASTLVIGKALASDEDGSLVLAAVSDLKHAAMFGELLATDEQLGQRQLKVLLIERELDKIGRAFSLVLVL